MFPFRSATNPLGWGEGGWEDGPRRDWRDRGVGPWVITSRWEVAEAAEGCECLVEFSAVMVICREPGGKPDWHEGCQECLCLFKDGKFINDEEDGVYVGCSDVNVPNEIRYCGIVWQNKLARHAAKLSGSGTYIKQVANGVKGALAWSTG